LSGNLADNASQRPFNHRRYYLPAILHTAQHDIELSRHTLAHTLLVPIHPPVESITHIWIGISNFRIFRQFLRNRCRRILTTKVTSMRGDSIKWRGTTPPATGGHGNPARSRAASHQTEPATVGIDTKRTTRQCSPWASMPTGWELNGPAWSRAQVCGMMVPSRGMRQ